MSKLKSFHHLSNKHSLKLKFVNKEVFLENKKLLPRQAYKRRHLLHIFITQALKDQMIGARYPTLLSTEELVKLLNLPINYDLETHLLKPIRSLSQQLDGALVSIKMSHTTLFFLDLENTKIEIN